MTVLHMDCVEGMKLFPDAYFDSIVCDPPYELGFMGKAWDASGIANNVAMWREALRVLKPGGHLLAFSGSRTYHRMACAIEDAGFEIRDQIMWVYGSGFPKSLDVSKAIDKAAGAEREVVGLKVYGDGRSYQGGELSARSGGGIMGKAVARPPSYEIAPATDAARQWAGWGTALKPAHEPIVVARKPLVGTVAANVLQFGTGAINIDACRVAYAGTNDATAAAEIRGRQTERNVEGWGMRSQEIDREEYLNGSAGLGRWPANLIHDGSPEVIAAFPTTPGQMAKASTADTPRNGQHIYGDMARGSNGSEPRGDAGSAARFFYCAKASRADRNAGCENMEKRPLNWSSGTQNPGSFQSEGTDKSAHNNHPTVKPTDLMRYLCRLVTPPGGMVLDPFAGSGSTGKACALEGFQFIGFELDEQYAAIAAARIEEARRAA